MNTTAGYPILFNQTPETLRRIGARARARNWHLCQRATPPPMATVTDAPAPGAPLETTAQAIASLDAQFPWLRGAEQPARR
jgi:hypothetical protein